ncbi:MAG: nuoN [Chloroflexi bacterium]|jgi:NADH-quinone oxidoreductase subunit N|nr:nuoN [Chloroflexota bacterium]
MNLSNASASLNAILPLVVVILWACALLLVDLFITKERKGLTALLAAIGMLASLIITLARLDLEAVVFNGMVTVDGFSNFLTVLFLGSGIVAVALSYDYLKRMGLEKGEYYVLLLFTVSGMMLMAVASDLIVVFLALELLSIPLYVLAGIATPRLDSEESSLKYFLLGSFSTGIVVYGIALVFGATGTTSLAGIVDAITAGSAGMGLLVAGAAMLLIGLGFKVALVPFHMWTPDVYQGAPSSVTAFMAIGAKAAGFAAILRIFIQAFPALSVDLTPVLWVLAALTMILGNVVAIAQRNIKRLLAYSSIANAGYILLALVPYGQSDVAADSVASALFYLLAYAFTSFTAWSVVIALEQVEGKGLELEDYAGLSRRYPILALTMTVAMLSFTGVPPTLGFLGKFYVFRTLLEGGFPGLAVIGVVTSLISAYYYLRVVVYMYMREGEPQAIRDPWLYIAATASAICLVVLGIFSQPLFAWASQAMLH